jgi:hypothetical protein
VKLLRTRQTAADSEIPHYWRPADAVTHRLPPVVFGSSFG